MSDKTHASSSVRWARFRFQVQPLQTAFEGLGERPLEVAATLRASPLDAFFTVAVPLALPGFLSACLLTFAAGLLLRFRWRTREDRAC